MSEDAPNPGIEERYQEYKNVGENVRSFDTTHYVVSLRQSGCLSESLKWVNQSDKPRVLIGGCYPGNASFDNVSIFGKKLGFDVDVMDHNPDAVTKLKERANEWIPSEHIFEGDLTDIPGEQKYNAIMLDYTTAFMSDEQVGEFAKQAEERLVDGGVVMIMVDAPVIDNRIGRLFDKFLKKRENKTDVASRSAEKTIGLMSGYKCIYKQEYDGNVLLTFAKSDDKRKEFRGGDSALDAENRIGLDKYLGVK